MTIKAINIKNSKHQNNFAKFSKFSISKALTTLMTATALGCVLPASDSFAKEFMFKPSVGIDFGIRSLQFHELYGKDHFASHYNHISPYVQVQILDHLGVQAGVETSDTRKTLKSYFYDERWLGADSGGPLTRFISSAKISGEFIGLYANTDRFWQDFMPTKISLFAGIAMLKAKMSHTELAGDAAYIVLGQSITSSDNLDSSKKAVPKIVLTCNFTLPKINIDGLSFKISYGFEKISNLQVQKTSSIIIAAAGDPNLLIKFKNSSYTTIGINYLMF